MLRNTRPTRGFPVSPLKWYSKYKEPVHFFSLIGIGCGMIIWLFTTFCTKAEAQDMKAAEMSHYQDVVNRLEYIQHRVDKIAERE